MDYVKTVLKEEIIIKKIVSVHYFEFAKDYIFEGEKHDFWEFIYADRGEVEVVSDNKGYRLKQGEILFHKPCIFHNEFANGKIAPNVIVIAFECKSAAMKYFEDRIISINDYEKNLLIQIINEAKKAFDSPFDDYSLKQLHRKPNSEFGCEQLIKIYLEQLLISFIRRKTAVKHKNRLSSSVKERSDKDMLNKVIDYLKSNIYNNIRFDDVLRFCKLGKTNLKVLFKEKTGTGVMKYYRNLKIEEAKILIREGQYNITEIAEKLGYDSIHYFSRQFKKKTGMSPMEYSISVKIKI